MCVCVCVCVCVCNIDNLIQFMVGEHVQFLFPSCEEQNEWARNERVSFIRISFKHITGCVVGFRSGTLGLLIYNSLGIYTIYIEM